MKRFFKFTISICSLLSLSGCPPWVSVNEANHTPPIESVEQSTSDFQAEQAVLL